MKYVMLLALVMLTLVGCRKEGGGQERVVVYTSVDQPVADPILKEFERRTGIKVDLQTDTEATKSAGLAVRLQAEKSNPQADVWWGNEIFHTINLAENGVLAAYDSPAVSDIPAKFKDTQHRWAGVCLRARVLGLYVNRAGSRSAKINGLDGLLDPSLKDKIGMARPTAGTTGGHVAALYTLWGDDKADAYFRGLRANGCKLLGGNSVVASQVGQGALFAGLTDNDDIEAAQKEGGAIIQVLPDQAENEQGTLAIPCTVGLVAGAKHTGAARKLIDYLLSAEVEQKLIEAKFGRYSVRPDPKAEPIRTMDVDYATVAKNLQRSVDRATSILDGR